MKIVGCDLHARQQTSCGRAGGKGYREEIANTSICRQVSPAPRSFNRTESSNLDRDLPRSMPPTGIQTSVCSRACPVRRLRGTVWASTISRSMMFC